MKQELYLETTSNFQYSHVLIRAGMEVCVVSSILSLLFCSTGRAGNTWRGRAVFRTRSRCVPQMIPTRWHGRGCPRWRRTSGAALPSRSSPAPHVPVSVLPEPGPQPHHMGVSKHEKIKGKLPRCFIFPVAIQSIALCHLVLLIIATWCGSYHIIDQSSGLQLFMQEGCLFFFFYSGHSDQIVQAHCQPACRLH